MPTAALVAVAVVLTALAVAAVGASLLILRRREPPGAPPSRPTAVVVPARAILPPIVAVPGPAAATSGPTAPAVVVPAAAQVIAGQPPHGAGDAAVTAVINVARRTLVLLGRQLDVVDGLERSELDPDTLDSLYRLDHLATRMRRYGESLLVLADADTGRQAREAMPLSDVLRTATSSVEQYGRVDLDLEVDPSVVSHRALTVAHLMAELLDNATAFSEPSTRVRVRAGVAGAGVCVVVTDEGLGIPDAEIASIHRLLAGEEEVSAIASTRLGFHVVARLARRLGAQVHLSRGGRGGTVVEVALPAAVLVAHAQAPTRPAAADQPPAVSLPPRSGLPRRRDLRMARETAHAATAAGPVGVAAIPPAIVPAIVPAVSPTPLVAADAMASDQLRRRSALASEALSELSLLAGYHPSPARPDGTVPLQRRERSDVPPPVPPAVVAPGKRRDPSVVRSVLAGFASGVRRGRDAGGAPAAGLPRTAPPVPPPGRRNG